MGSWFPAFPDKPRILPLNEKSTLHGSHRPLLRGSRQRWQQLGRQFLTSLPHLGQTDDTLSHRLPAKKRLAAINPNPVRDTPQRLPCQAATMVVTSTPTATTTAVTLSQRGSSPCLENAAAQAMSSNTSAVVCFGTTGLRLNIRWQWRSPAKTGRKGKFS